MHFDTSDLLTTSICLLPISYLVANFFGLTGSLEGKWFLRILVSGEMGFGDLGFRKNAVRIEVSASLERVVLII